MDRERLHSLHSKDRRASRAEVQGRLFFNLKISVQVNADHNRADATLLITVCKATGLAVMDLGGTSDPYVVLKVAAIKPCSHARWHNVILLLM